MDACPCGIFSGVCAINKCNYFVSIFVHYNSALNLVWGTG